MRSLMSLSVSLSFLFANSVNAAKLAEPAVQVDARALYQGGWPLALMASESTGCPVEAPVTCQNQYTASLECCPSGQICHISANYNVQYCCPTESDCLVAIANFPVCANSSWIMYSDGSNLFCCESGYTASWAPGVGFCEPAGVVVPAEKLAQTVSQDTVAASQPSSTAVISVSEITATELATTSTTTATAGVVFTNTTNSIALSTAIDSSSIPSMRTSATITASTVTNPASGTASGSASTSAKTGTSIGASNNPAVMDAVIALCLGIGMMALLG